MLWYILEHSVSRAESGGFNLKHTKSDAAHAHIMYTDQVNNNPPNNMHMRTVKLCVFKITSSMVIKRCILEAKIL